MTQPHSELSRSDRNMTQASNLVLRALSEADIGKVHAATLEVLARTGSVVHDPDALELLHGAGAAIADDHTVRIPAEVIERAISQAPRRVDIYDRNGALAMALEGRNTYFGAHGDCPEILDPATGRRRRFLAADGAATAKVCDALPNIRFVSLNGFADDCPDPAAAAPLMFREMVCNTTKPLGFGCADEHVLDAVLELAVMVAGSSQRLRERPFLYHYSEPTTPLVHSGPSLRRLLRAVDAGIPLVYTPMPMAGATAPCSPAAALVVGNAEVLTGLTIAQLRRPGTPCIYGGIPGIMDMRDTIYAYGAPEMLLMVAAMTELAHHYELPMFGTAGCTDAKTVDQQAAVEAALSCHMALLTGANLVHDVGLIDHADVVSAEMIVLCDEIIAMLGHTVSGIDVRASTLLTDLIHRVGPGGNYLAEEHTVRHFREAWFPGLMDRTRAGLPDEAGRPSFSARLRERTLDLMRRHDPEPLSDGVRAELDRFVGGLIGA